MSDTSFTFSRRSGRNTAGPKAEFDQLEATELYCPACRRAVPVRRFLLLILPEGDNYEYRCQYCGTKVGDKIDRAGPLPGLVR